MLSAPPDTNTASAVVATVDDLKQFKNGAQFGAWLGSITKRGDTYLRTLLNQGAKSVVLK